MRTISYSLLEMHKQIAFYYFEECEYLIEYDNIIVILNTSDPLYCGQKGQEDLFFQKKLYPTMKINTMFLVIIWRKIMADICSVPIANNGQYEDACKSLYIMRNLNDFQISSIYENEPIAVVEAEGNKILSLKQSLEQQLNQEIVIQTIQYQINNLDQDAMDHQLKAIVMQGYTEVDVDNLVIEQSLIALDDIE